MSDVRFCPRCARPEGGRHLPLSEVLLATGEEDEVGSKGQYDERSDRRADQRGEHDEDRTGTTREKESGKGGPPTPQLSFRVDSTRSFRSVDDDLSSLEADKDRSAPDPSPPPV